MSKVLCNVARLPHDYTFCVLFICVYLCVLLKLSLSSDAKICRMIAFVDPGHICQIPIETRNIEDCSICSKNVILLLDRYFFAHLFGWFIKALIVPNKSLLWTASIVFEIVEVLLIPYIPSLHECWWDSLCLDMFGCNAVGIHLGTLFARKALLTRQVIHTSFNHLFLLLVAITLTDVNAFFIKQIFFIRSSSPLNIYRLLAFIALAGCSHRRYSYRGSQRFYALFYVSILCAEGLIILLRWYRIACSTAK